MSNAFCKRSPGNAEWARDLLRNRFRVAILELDTDATVRGVSAMSRKCTVAKCLSEARARGSRVLFVLVVSIAMFRKRISFMRLADEEKKKHSYEYFFKCRLVESLQSTCPDVCRRGHHWLYRRLHRHCRPR